MAVVSLVASIAFLLVPAAAPEDASGVRTLVVSVTDGGGSPIQGLAPHDVAVLEDGVAREVTRVERDERPLNVAVLVDTSQAVGSDYRLNVIEAVTAFVARLPVGSRYSLWTTGDRPTKAVELGDDRAAAGAALKRVAPQGGNTVLDALVEAAKDLEAAEGARQAVVAVTGLGTEFSNRERHQVVEAAQRTGALFGAVVFETGPVSAEERLRYEYVLSTLAKGSGGIYESLLTPMGLRDSLQRIAKDLGSHYRVTYAAGPTRKGKQPKLEVTVARPDARVRVSPARPAKR